MTSSTHRQVFLRLRECMSMDSLSPQEQALCEQKIALTERIDQILFTEWDPIGVHLLEGFDCEGEYDSYLPVIVDMVTAGASLNDIADALYEFEEMIMGENLTCRRRCHIAAAKILGCDPANDDLTVTAQRQRCTSCHGRDDLALNARCIDSPASVTKPTIQFID